jgi:hypothetical protein
MANPEAIFREEGAEKRFNEAYGGKSFELVQAERRLKLFRADRDSLDEELDTERREEMQERVDVEKQTIEELSTPEESLAESVVKAPVRATKTVAQAGVDATKTVAGATKTVAQAGADATIAVATAPLKGARALTDAVGLTTKTEEEPEEGEPEVGMAVDLDGDGIPDAFLKKNGWKRDKKGRIRNKGKFVKVEQLEKAKEENLSPRKPKLKTKR